MAPEKVTVLAVIATVSVATYVMGWAEDEQIHPGGALVCFIAGCVAFYFMVDVLETGRIFCGRGYRDSEGMCQPDDFPYWWLVGALGLSGSLGLGYGFGVAVRRLVRKP